jgi:carboxypeptidase family protein
VKQLLVLIVFATSSLAQTKQPTGEIRGTVIDQSGKPVSAATVYAVPQGLFNDAIPRSVKTDSNGVFDFRGGFQLGPYKLYSRKDADGYPDPLDTFYADPKAEVPEVSLSVDHPASNAILKMGRQAAVLAGRIIDPESGAGLRVRLAVLDSQGHGHSLIVDGDYRVLLPSGKNLTLMVMTLDPVVDRSSVQSTPLRLEPGQYVYMDLPVARQ